MCRAMVLEVSALAFLKYQVIVPDVSLVSKICSRSVEN